MAVTIEELYAKIEEMLESNRQLAQTLAQVFIDGSAPPVVSIDNGEPVKPVPAPVTAAYDRPELTVEQIDHKAIDGKSVQLDGSVWAMQNYGPTAGTPVCTYYGYISPTKRPDIWEFAKKHFDPVTFERWESAWKQNPYGIYKADIREKIANGSADFMLFSYVYGQPKRTFVQ